MSSHRRRIASTLLVLFIASGFVHAEEPSGAAVVDELVRWTRSAIDELRLEGAPPPHRVVLAVSDVKGYNVRTSFGELVQETPLHRRQGRVEVVVGDDRLDSSRFSVGRQRRNIRGNRSPRQQLSLTVEDGELALARDLWLAVDTSYKNAVQQWKAKVAAGEAQGGEPPPPDWSPAEPIVAVSSSPLPSVDEAPLRALALDASRVLWELGGLDSGDVSVNLVDVRFRLVTSEGTRIVQPEEYVVVHAAASLLTEDGVSIDDELQWVVRRPAELPSAGEIAARVRAMGMNVIRRAAAEDIEYYEGPVVFEDHAAAQFLRYLMPPELSGTPPAPEQGRSYQQQTRSGPRLGRRLLPRAWSVADDPARDPRRVGGFVFDREGVRAQRVELVRDGYVRDLLMSRVPRAELGRSNGHSRGRVSGDWLARPAVWTARPPKNLPDRAFERAVERVVRSSGLDRILVVKRLARGRPGKLPSPTLALWRYADGREETVSSLEFQNVDRRTLRNIAAAGGGEIVLAYLAGWTPSDKPAADRGLPTSLAAPRRLLVEDLELVFPGTSQPPHAYPRAGAASGGESTR